jgi:hypothetical protein
MIRDTSGILWSRAQTLREPYLTSVRVGDPVGIRVLQPEVINYTLETMMPHLTSTPYCVVSQVIYHHTN